MKYAGIGSRETPRDILDLMADEAKRLASEGHTLRSGHAKGADRAFEHGCDLVRGHKEIYKAEEYCKRRTESESVFFVGYDPEIWPKAFELAEHYHPNWAACRGYARKLHARNGFIVLGSRLDDPVDFVVCWTEGGKLKGGTAQALRIAEDHGIPVLNYGSNE